ncbi:MAG: major facilitator superfamily transporter [Pedosphaera sp.]|nr:major facilitator superfamily transporter [Pedosphaera sp.]
MSFGFWGIQFGWGLQMANMSAIYEYLGAKPDQIPLLWLAAPLTGLLIQPIIGHMSDRTWGRLGRRRPYFLTGAILSSLALVLMPNSSALWMAAGLLWILDASINISMEPFRAFVADMLPEKQRTRGFAMQSLFIGLGAIVASALPWMMTHWFGISNATGVAQQIPLTVKYSFYLGAAAFFIAVLWTILSTREYPPDDLASFRKMKTEKAGLGRGAAEIVEAILKMPPAMRQLAWVQIFTWLGLFCMWLYFPVAVAHNVFGAPDEKSPLYAEGTEWGGLCFAMYSVVTFIFSFFLVGLAQKFNRKWVHTICLICGAAGLLSVAVIHNKYLLLISMTGVGIAWASILSMPYAILAGSLPPGKTGVYMGIFNFFIVLPEIAASLGFGWVMNHLLNNNRLAAVIAGGVFLLIAAILTQRVKDVADETVAV